MPRKKTKLNQLESMSVKITDWVGTPKSIIAHTLAFAATFMLILFGIKADTVMLLLTTLVSLEAIYLALFIQMTVNRQAKSISEVEKDIDEIQEDVEAIEDIQEDLSELQDAEKEEEIGTDRDFARTEFALKSIEENIHQLNSALAQLKTDIKTSHPIVDSGSTHPTQNSADHQAEQLVHSNT